MADLRDLLAGGEALKADLEAVRAVVDLAARWPELAGRVGDITSAEALLDRLDKDIASPAVAEAFAAIHAEALLAKLERAVQAVKAADASLPNNVRRLLRTTGSFDETAADDPGLVAWTLDASQATPLGEAMSLTLKAKGQIEFEAGDTGFAVAALPGPLLRLRAEGKLGGDGTARLPFDAGSVGVSAAASVDVSLEYFFKVAAADTLYGAAVAERLTRLPNPFDYDAVWRAFGDDLAGLAYHFDGATNVGLEVSLADTIDLGAGASAALGATISVGAALQAVHTLELRAGPEAIAGGRQVLARLVRRQVRSADFKGSLGLTVDASALAGRVHTILQRAVGAWDTTLVKVRPFLSPGTWLQSEAAGNLAGKAAAALLAGDANQDLRDALVRDLRGAVGVDTTDASAVVGWLQKELAGAFDRASLVSRGEAGVEAAVTALVGRLPALAQAEFAGRIEATVDALAGQVQAALVAEVEWLTGPQGPGIAAAGAAIREAGAAAEAQFADADELLAGVRAAAERYDALFQDVLKKSEAAAKQKITAALQVEESRLRETDGQFVGAFLANTPAAAEVFAALTHGRLTELADLFDGRAVAGFALSGEESSLRRHAKSVSKHGFEFVLLNFGGVTGSDLLTAEASSLVDGAGNVQIDATANLTRKFRGLREGREVSFADVYRLSLAGSLADGPPTVLQNIELGVNVSHQDESLKRSEVGRFFESLAGPGLISQAVLTAARVRFDTWMRPGSDRLVADISARLWLTGAAARRLLSLDDRTAGGLSDAARAHIVAVGIQALADAGAIDLPRFLKDEAVVLSRFPKKAAKKMTAPQIVLQFRTLYPTLGPHWSDPKTTENNQRVGRFAQVQGVLMNLVQLVELMGEAYVARPVRPGIDDPTAWDEKRYRDQQARIGACSRDWLKTGEQAIFWVSSEVHPRTVAFFCAIADLAGAPREGAISLTMTNHAADGPSETVVLSPGLAA